MFGARETTRTISDIARETSRQVHNRQVAEYASSILAKRMEAYQKSIVDSNEALPTAVDNMYNRVKASGTFDNEGGYRLGNNSDGSAAEGMMSRFSSRYNRAGAFQNRVTATDEVTQRLTNTNNTRRLNQATEISEDKRAFDTYNTLFSRFLGNLNGETQMKKQRSLGLDSDMYSTDYSILKNITQNA